MTSDAYEHSFMPEGINRMRKRTCIYLDVEQHEKLLILNTKTGAPIAEIVRRAINAHLSQFKEVEEEWAKRKVRDREPRQAKKSKGGKL